MFFKMIIQREILLEPENFGRDLETIVKRRAILESEGSSLGKLGLVVSILDFVPGSIRPGPIRYDTGCVIISLEMEALIFRPFVNEVMDVIVSLVNKRGLFARLGQTAIFVHKDNIREEFHYNDDKDVFEVDMAEAEDEVDVGLITIQVGTILRVRVIGVSIQSGQMSAVGTLKGDCLGVIGDASDIQ